MSRNTVFVIIFLIFIAAPFAFIEYVHFPYSDGAEHGAAVRALASNILHPGDPMLNLPESGSPRYVPSIVVMGLVMKLLSLDVFAVLKLFSIAYFLLFLISVALFSTAYFGDSGQASWSIVFLLFFWGLGWQEANAYMFSALIASAYYPSVVAFSLAFLSLYCQINFLKQHRLMALIAAIALGALSFMNHPLTGCFYLVSAGLLYLEKSGINKKTVFCYSISVVATICLLLCWPYYSFFDAFIKVATGSMRETLDYNLTYTYFYSKVLFRVGPALAGIPILFYYFKHRQYLLLWGGCAIFCCTYMAGYFLSISLAERSIFFAICFLQLSAARLCREKLSLAQHRVPTAKHAVSGVLRLFLAGGMLLQGGIAAKNFLYHSLVFTEGASLPHYQKPNAVQHELKKYLKPGDIVMSYIYPAWSIPVYTGAKIIALYHTPPHIVDHVQRIRDVKEFFSTSVSPERRKEILARYGATHVFIDFIAHDKQDFIIDGKQLVPILKELGYAEIVHRDLFSIFSVPK